MFHGFFFSFNEKVIGSTVTVKVYNQCFGLAIRETAQLNLYPFDGILGLAYAAAARIGHKTLVDQLFEQGQIKQRLFCVKLHYKEESAPSECIIGGCDTKAEYWIPVVRKFLWTVTLVKIVFITTANGSKFAITPNAEATFDTGGTLSKICGKKTII